jgi:hypothetical protein
MDTGTVGDAGMGVSGAVGYLLMNVAVVSAALILLVLLVVTFMPRKRLKLPKVTPPPMPTLEDTERDAGGCLSRLVALRQEVESLLDGDDVRIASIGMASGGWHEEVVLACGETRGMVFRLPTESSETACISKQVRSLVRWLRACEAKRISDEAALQSTVARFYA